MAAAGLPPGIGRYRPLELLGSGGMGTVYRAHDPLIDRQVAIKVVRTDTLDPAIRAEYLARFRQEAQLAGSAPHPAIVGVYDFGEQESGDPYIVMELVPGRSLQQLLRDAGSGRGGTPALMPILFPVLGGLGHLHARGITHRDIKPGNIIVTPAGEAKIADFGIAHPGAAVRQGSALTRVGAMLGTPSYMAPEQLDGEAIDHRADLFAVGAVLYHILAGRPPFSGRSEIETIRLLASPDPAPMGPLEAAGRAGFVPLLCRALAKPPAQRFQSAAEFAAALAAIPGSAIPNNTTADDTTILAPRLSPVPPRRQWDTGTLQRVERALAPHVGPMARVIVEQASRQSATADELYQALASQLQNTTDRNAFLRALGGGRIEPTLGPATRRADIAAPTTGNLTGNFTGNITRNLPTAGGEGALPPAALVAAQAALAFFVGPIARVLVRDAARQAASPADFIERLCTQVTKPEERLALRRRLRAEVEPILR